MFHLTSTLWRCSSLFKEHWNNNRLSCHFASKQSSLTTLEGREQGVNHPWVLTGPIWNSRQVFIYGRHLGSLLCPLHGHLYPLTLNERWLNHDERSAIFSRHHNLASPCCGVHQTWLREARRANSANISLLSLGRWHAKQTIACIIGAGCWHLRAIVIKLWSVSWGWTLDHWPYYLDKESRQGTTSGAGWATEKGKESERWEQGPGWRAEMKTRWCKERLVLYGLKMVDLNIGAFPTLPN